jgi:hypothetical protein
VLSDSGGGYGGDGGGTSGGGGETIGFADGGAGGGQSCGGPTDSGGNGDTDGGDFNVSAGGGGGGGYCGGGGGEARTYQNDYCHGAGGGGASGIINRGYSTSISTGGGNSGDGLIEVEYAQAPADPQNAAQTVQGDDEIDLTWDENSNGGPVDDYDVQVSEDGGSYSTVVSTYSGTSYTYTADPAANEHRFRVRANNSDGSSGFTYSETVATDATNLAVTGTARSEISFAWDGVRDATGYEVLRAEATGSAVADYTSVATPTTSPYTGTGLEDGERYYYRVRATYPGTDSQLTAEVNASTPLPAPTHETLDKSTPREVRIGYTLNDNSTDGDIRIERSADGGTTWTESASITDLSTTEYTDTGLLDGQEYTYRLTRRTDHVETGSATASAITILPAPTDLTNPTIGEASAEYAWTATHNQGQTRVEYRRAVEGDSWTTYETVGNETESATVDGLLNGEQYEGRVVAETDDAETEDE